ncbi:MAG: HAMP domain-containing protein, partial [Chitinophagaceae bacterium]
MQFRHLPIERKLTRVILSVAGISLAFISIFFLAYQYQEERKSMLNNISAIGKIVAANSTAAVAFNDKESSVEILSSLRSKPHIIASCIFDANGQLFSYYPASLKITELPKSINGMGYFFSKNYLEGYEAIEEGDMRFGTLYLKSDLEQISDELQIFVAVTLMVLAFSFLLAIYITRIFQKNISKPIIALAETALLVSKKKDYSIRATKVNNDEVGLLTDALNQMMAEIQHQTASLIDRNQKIIRHSKELEVANRELEQFAYVSSHDLQEPLRTITNFVGLLQKQLPQNSDASTLQFMSFITAATSKMQLLIKHLLGFSRIGRETILDHVDCNKLLQEIQFELDGSIKETNAQITVHELPIVTGDKLALKQVFQNLLSNAIKFRKKNVFPIIEIKAEEKEKEFLFTVTDNGIGFDEIYKERIFIIFQRLHTDTSYLGTGIG